MSPPHTHPPLSCTDPQRNAADAWPLRAPSAPQTRCPQPAPNPAAAGYNPPSLQAPSAGLELQGPVWPQLEDTQQSPPHPGHPLPCCLPTTSGLAWGGWGGWDPLFCPRGSRMFFPSAFWLEHLTPYSTPPAHPSPFQPLRAYQRSRARALLCAFAVCLSCSERVGWYGKGPQQPPPPFRVLFWGGG